MSSQVLLAQKPYSAGEIQSKESVQFGRFEMLMYSSDKSGTTSTFFMWKDGGQTSNLRWNEIDIETFGKDVDRWQSNPIWQYDDNDQNIKRWEGFHSGMPVANTWVKFGLEWTPDYIAWFANDVEVRRIVKGENGGGGLDPVGHITDPMRMSFNHWSAFSVAWLGEFYPAQLPSYQFVDWFTYQPWNGNGFDAISTRYDFNSINELIDNFYISSHTFDDNRCDFESNAVGVTEGVLWFGIFNKGQERDPIGAEIPFVIVPVVHEVPGLIEAEEFAAQMGLQIETVVETEGKGTNIGYTDNGDYATYNIDVQITDEYEIRFRLASLTGDGRFSVSVDGIQQIEIVEAPNTGDWQAWETISETLMLTEGKHELRFDVTEAGFNMNWMDIKDVLVTTQRDDYADIDLAIFPNPSHNGAFRLNKEVQWNVYSMEGELIDSGSGHKVDLRKKPKGVYTLFVKDEKIMKLLHE